MVTTGGTSLKDDIMRLYQPTHIIVATPGRIVDLAGKGVAKLNKCGVLVMDEVSGETRKKLLEAWVQQLHSLDRAAPLCRSGCLKVWAAPEEPHLVCAKDC